MCSPVSLLLRHVPKLCCEQSYLSGFCIRNRKLIAKLEIIAEPPYIFLGTSDWDFSFIKMSNILDKNGIRYKKHVFSFPFCAMHSQSRLTRVWVSPVTMKL
jgi:hypothetical protein